MRNIIEYITMDGEGPWPVALVAVEIVKPETFGVDAWIDR